MIKMKRQKDKVKDDQSESKIIKYYTHRLIKGYRQHTCKLWLYDSHETYV